MLIKPFGLCCKCSNRKTCIVVTETNAKVLDCPDANKSDLKSLEPKKYKTTNKH